MADAPAEPIDHGGEGDHRDDGPRARIATDVGIEVRG
jgi:hypothetical protein